MSNAATRDNQTSSPPATAPADTSSITRQAIVDDKGKVLGYELYDRSHPFSDSAAASDAQMLLNVLSNPATANLVGKRIIFVNCSHASLEADHLDLIKPDRVVLEIPPIAGHDPVKIAAAVKAMTAVRSRGFKLAFNQHVLNAPYAAWLPLASYLKINLNTFKPQLIEPVIQLAKKKMGVPIIVEKIETAEQRQRVAAMGVQLFQGGWFAKPVIVKDQTVQPAHATIIQLISLVRKQARVEQIEEVLKRDATLSFNLLRYINSSGFGLSTEITSFRHAVMILGLTKLFRWAALLLTMPRPGGSPPAVGNSAIVRGRLMELLAVETLPKDEHDNAFVAGVFSMLDTMLGIPMEKAISAVSLPETITDALLHKKGPLAPLLELTIACEAADDLAFAQATEALQLSNHQVNWAHLQALAWAESLGV